MIDYKEFLEGQLGKALQALPPKQQADMNRFVQKMGAVMGDETKTGEQKTAAALLIAKEMNEKYANNDNK